MDSTKFNTEDYRFHNVVISPYLTPLDPGKEPSFIGNVSINKQYTIHYKHNHFVSVNCALTERPVDIDFTCAYAGIIIYPYGHALIESLANLYFIKHLPGNIPLVFTGNGLSFFHRHHRELFELFNLKNEIIHLKRTTRFRDIYVPPPGATLNSYIIHEQFDALGIIPPNPQKGKKLYISRSRCGDGGARNERELEDVLKKRNWQICYPEQMGVRDQVELYASCETIFCISGSALHSIIMLKNPEQRFIVIPRIHNNLYNMIAAAKTNNYYLLNCKRKIITPEIKDPATQIFMLDIDEIRRELEQTDDFQDLSKSQIITRPDKPKEGSYQIPDFFFEPAPKPKLEHTLFYRIMYALYNCENIESGIRALAYLLRKGLIKTYMRDKCKQFVNTYCPVYAYALGKCLDPDHHHLDACRDILRDQDNTDNLKAALINYKRLVNEIMDRPLLCYSLHLSNIGWTTSQIEGSMIGAPHSGESIEAIKINFETPYKKVEYAVKTNEDGWLCAENGEIAGTTGNSRPIHGIRIHIPEAASNFLRFRIHFARHWSRWCANGQAVEFPNFIASALQIELMK